MTLGEYIKDTRAKMQLSQPQLAEQIGIEQSYLSKLENVKTWASGRREKSKWQLPVRIKIAAPLVQPQSS